MSKLQKKPAAHKRGHPTLKNMIFSTFVGHFCPPGSGSTGPIEYGFNTDPDPKPWLSRQLVDLTIAGYLKKRDCVANESQSAVSMSVLMPVPVFSLRNPLVLVVIFNHCLYKVICSFRNLCWRQCCGSGSVTCWASRIRILKSTSQKIKKKPLFSRYCFVNS